MPTNLNALIRYKIIDKCMRNRYIPCTLERLVSECSEALGEHRGIYKQVSERTIYEDLRVMKSDMLGFNAPIVFERGYYLYSDSDYSIFNVSITEENLLKEIMRILIDAREKLDSFKLTGILQELSRITGIDMPKETEVIIEEKEITSESKSKLKSDSGIPQILYLKKAIKEVEQSSNYEEKLQFDLISKKAKSTLSWNKILDLV
jgi:hypothetical protein